jgi:PilZ domain
VETGFACYASPVLRLGSPAGACMMDPHEDDTSDDILLPPDRRRSPRTTARRSATLYSAVDPLAPGVPVVLHDISSTGVGFTVKQRLTIGQMVVLDIMPARLKAEVFWAQFNAETQECRVGCMWIQSPTDHGSTRLV